MRADNSGHLLTAARRRSQTTRQRTAAALRRLDAAGKPITFDALAREANVSRSWLYSQSDLRSEVERLRDQRRPHRHHIPDRQRTSDASLQRRLEAAAERVRQLEADNPSGSGLRVVSR
jgi:DNA-directed RNA polymerase sigma subunit (sigma70/sigma32)